jgi:flavoprotein
MMTKEQIQKIAVEVIGKLAVRLGANGSKGILITLLTAATAEFEQAIDQIRCLVLNGYKIQLLLSENAEALYGKVMRDQLAGYPHIDSLDTSDWLKSVKESDAIVVPLLSMNTLSKISMLIADNLVTNLILHALFSGKPVFAGQNGAHPDAVHWSQKLGISEQNPTLRQTVLKRMETVRGYGCHLMDTRDLKSIVNKALSNKQRSITTPSGKGDLKKGSAICLHVKTVTAAHVRQAHMANADLILPPGALITPLAWDMAMTYRVELIKTDN